ETRLDTSMSWLIRTPLGAQNSAANEPKRNSRRRIIGPPLLPTGRILRCRRNHLAEAWQVGTGVCPRLDALETFIAFDYGKFNILRRRSPASRKIRTSGPKQHCHRRRCALTRTDRRGTVRSHYDSSPTPLGRVPETRNPVYEVKTGQAACGRDELD